MKRTLSDIKSPFTDEKVYLVEDIERWDYKGEWYNVHVQYYEGEKTKEQFTTTEQDEASFGDLYAQYNQRHNKTGKP